MFDLLGRQKPNVIDKYMTGSFFINCYQFIYLFITVRLMLLQQVIIKLIRVSNKITKKQNGKTLSG